MWKVLGVIAVLSAGAPASPPPTASADAASHGLYVALRVCSACHKVAMPGAGPDVIAPSFAVIHARHDAEDLRRLLQQISTEGHRDMPPIPMSAQEADDVAAYIATVPPSPPALAPRGDRRRAPGEVHPIAFSSPPNHAQRRSQ